MATWQANTVGGTNPITAAILGLGKAMFDPEVERLAQVRASNAAVDQAQIAKYAADGRKLDSDTALNNQQFGARDNAEAAYTASLNPDGTLNPQKAGAIYANMMKGGGANGGDVSQFGNVLSQIMLGQDPATPGFVQNATTAMMRQGKTPDMNFAPTPGRADAISARDAGEAFKQAVTTQGMGDATSRANNAATNAQSGANNAATIANAFDMNTADNVVVVRGQDLTAKTSTANNAADNARAILTNTADNQRALATNAADNVQSGVNNQLDNQTSVANNAADNARQAAIDKANKMVISPDAGLDIDTRVSAAFDNYDFDQGAQNATETRAAQLFQHGDPATNLMPGNPAGSVAQAFSELISIEDDAWVGGTPNAVLKTPTAPAAAQPAAATPAAAPAAQGAPPVAGAQKAPDGNWYVPDPARPGKYLMVQ